MTADPIDLPPIQAQLRTLTLNGVSIMPTFHQINIYESIYKPYHTAKLQLEDNINLVENLNLRGGEPFRIAFDSYEPFVYGNLLYLFAIKGQQSKVSGRSASYSIELIGHEYFSDKKNIVQNAFKNVPATSAIQQIFNQYIGGALNIKMPSIGPVSKEGYIKAGVKPFRAIDDLRKVANFGGQGNAMFFKNAKNCVLSPLNTLFGTMRILGRFTEIKTIGTRWPEDIIRERDIIIASYAEVDTNKNGRGGTDAIAAAASQALKTFDHRTKKVVRDLPAKAIGAFRNLPGIGGKHGGFPNYTTMDGAHQPTSIDPASKLLNERFGAAMLKNGPMITVKVPIQSGMYCTVGDGVHLTLLPIMSTDTEETGNAGISDMSGDYLVVDLCHELKLKKMAVYGTTTMSCAKR